MSIKDYVAKVNHELKVCLENESVLSVSMHKSKN